jgi:aryl-alcohol dehydrogenase-like predicted oxidoreductase
MPNLEKKQPTRLHSAADGQAAKSQQQKANNQQLTAKIALGTVQFGLNYGISNDSGQTSKAEVKKILEEAAKHGVKIIDTARVYGSSEEILGHSGVNQFDVVTKLDPADLQINGVKEQVRNSLKRLNITKLYGVLFHNAESALASPEEVNTLQKLKEKGLVKKTGYSLYTPEELNKLLNKYPLPDLIQVPFNLLDKRFESQLVKLHDEGVEIHTRSTFLQGLFFVNPDTLGSFFNPVKSFIAALQKEFTSQQELADYLLQGVLKFGFIDKVVIGVNTACQLHENISGLLSTRTQIHIDIPTVNDSILMPNLWPR